MSAVIHRLASRPDRLRRDEASSLRQALLPFLEDPSSSSAVLLAAGELVAHLDRKTASSNRWTFVMLSPDQNAAVVDFLAGHAARPLVSVRLWALCFKHLRMDTGEVMLSREAFAEALGIPAREVSRCMTELVSFGAISRRRDPVAGLKGAGPVRYFMNPRVATHLSGAGRDAAQAAAPVLELVGGSARPSDRRARLSSFPAVVL